MSPRFAILNPCQKRWTDLSGEGRKRFCDECQTDVHALDRYSLEEFAELKRKSGRVCGFLSGESLPEPRSRRAILIGAFFTAISPLLAQSGRLRIRVTDPSGAMLPGAQVVLLGVDDKPQRTERTNERGEVIWTDLSIGDSRLLVSSPGFKNLRLTATARNENEAIVNAKLEVGEFLMGVIVEARVPEPRPAEISTPLALPAPKMVAVPPPDVTGPPIPVAQPPRPKRHWWQIFR